MRAKVGGRRVIAFACGNYTVRGWLVPAPRHCPLCGPGCKVVSVVDDPPRVDKYDPKTKTWHTVKAG